LKRINIELHPFMFALWPIALKANLEHSWTFNVEFPVPCLMSLCFAAVLYGTFWPVFRNNTKASLAASVVIIWFFFYSDVLFALKTISQSLFRCDCDVLIINSVYFAAIFILILLVARSAQIGAQARRALNLVSLALFSYNALMYTILDFQTIPLCNAIKAEQISRDRPVPNTTDQQLPDDIYYIIYDAMGRDDVLEKRLNYHSHGFVEKLQMRGFEVCEKSTTNYEFTFSSLASSLNMEYLSPLQMHPERFRWNEVKVLGSLIRENRIARVLSKAGYRFYNYSSGFGPTEWIPEADVNIFSGAGSGFTVRVLDSTALRSLPAGLNPTYALARYKRTAILDKIDDVLTDTHRKFVFLHIETPHAPYLFQRDGSKVEENYKDQFDIKPVQYLDQLEFAQGHLLKLMDKILSAKRRAIIVVQGDHGPHFNLEHTAREHEIALPILNAYYLPDGGKEKLYNTITPVNSFRLIFDYYLKVKYEQLRNENYHSYHRLPLTSCRCITDQVVDGDVIIGKRNFRPPVEKLK
jgi:hypothetical protein